MLYALETKNHKNACDKRQALTNQREREKRPKKKESKNEIEKKRKKQHITARIHEIYKKICVVSVKG